MDRSRFSVRRVFPWLIPAIAIVCFVLFNALWRQPDMPADATAVSAFRSSQEALSNRDFEAAERLGLSVPIDHPDGPSARIVAGEAASLRQEFARAVEIYSQIPRDNTPASLIAVFAVAEIHRTQGKLSDAVRDYRYVLQYSPDDSAAHERMAFLLALSGQYCESYRHFASLLFADEINYEELVLLADIQRHFEQREFVADCLKSEPQDSLVQLAHARQLIVDGQTKPAVKILRGIVSKQPRLGSAHAMLGEVLLSEDDASFAEWYLNLPAEMRAHPEVSWVCGMYARKHERIKIASRCFWETLRLIPVHRRSVFQLGQSLTSRGLPSGQFATEGAKQLFELTKLMDTIIQSDGQDSELVRRLVNLFEKLGRLREARAWSIYAVQQFPTALWPSNTLQRLESRITSDTDIVIPSSNFAILCDCSKDPDFDAHFRPVFSALVGSDSDRIAQRPLVPSRFEIADRAGINHVYFNAHDPKTSGARMQEQTGGGVGILDLDMDLWPDVFLTQGTSWPSGSRSPVPNASLRDRLFRNSVGSTFTDVTELALPNETGFGQGCAVGDFNEDGFPDLLISNIGPNQLLRNNGDGTFTDVTQQSSLTGSLWSTSCLFADMNADGHVDLFEAAYLKGDELFIAICDGKACSPTNFLGEQNRLFLGNGDGTFQSPMAIGPEEDSKSLGVLALDMDGSGQLCLIIANDQVPNFLFRNQTKPNPDEPSTSGIASTRVNLREEGFLSGVAFNKDGLAMACMGIATDDINRDGKPDLLMTNFLDETNTLYVQDPGGLFTDATDSAGLGGPSLSFVSWGTQFLDANLDSAPDLIIVSGHVDDYRPEGGEFEMRPQFFLNSGQGQFEEQSPDIAGEFFGTRAHGRAVARIDWNGDGLPEFIASPINEPTNVLLNITLQPGHGLTFSFVAVDTPRDAIGTRIEVKTPTKNPMRQLVAGDGYHASNERVLQVGLGTESEASETIVYWPSGSTSRTGRIPAGLHLRFIENSRFARVVSPGSSITIPVEVRPAPLTR